MLKISPLHDVDELMKLWPRLLTISNRETSWSTTDQVLRVLLLCLDHGAIFLARGDHGLVGFACVERMGDTAILHCIPADNGEGLGRACLDAIKKWAMTNDIAGIKATTSRLCGSSFRYFEKSLGFRRNSVTFYLKV